MFVLRAYTYIYEYRYIYIKLSKNNTIKIHKLKLTEYYVEYDLYL